MKVNARDRICNKKIKTTINSDRSLFQFCLLFLPFPPPTNVGPAVVFSAPKQYEYICEDDVFLAANIGRWGKGSGVKQAIFQSYIANFSRALTLFYFVPN